MSYDGGVSFGVTGDHEAVPDLGTLCAGIRDGIDELLKEVPSVPAHWKEDRTSSTREERT